MRVRAEKVLPSGSTYYNSDVVGQGDCSVIHVWQRRALSVSDLMQNLDPSDAR